MEVCNCGISVYKKNIERHKLSIKHFKQVEKNKKNNILDPELEQILKDVATTKKEEQIRKDLDIKRKEKIENICKELNDYMDSLKNLPKEITI